MKRELKVVKAGSGGLALGDIARPIPMKRELKEKLWPALQCSHDSYRKAHPDEKGTESIPPLILWACKSGISQGPSR